jgi:hypothetical protein
VVVYVFSGFLDKVFNNFPINSLQLHINAGPPHFIPQFCFGFLPLYHGITKEGGGEIKFSIGNKSQSQKEPERTKNMDKYLTFLFSFVKRSTPKDELFDGK